jgi:hypothetical protein
MRVGVGAAVVSTVGAPGASAHSDTTVVDWPVMAGWHSRGVNLGDSTAKSLTSTIARYTGQFTLHGVGVDIKYTDRYGSVRIRATP